MSVQIDHVIYATGDLDEVAARLEAELGLVAVGGGRHEGLGTHNRIVPLDRGFVELLAVADAEEAARSDLGRALQARLDAHGDGLFGWVVAAGDVEPVAARLGTTVTTIARAGLAARLTGVAEAARDPFLPFFISRDPGIPGPTASGDLPAITWIEVAGDAAQLDAWLGGAELPVRVVAGKPGVRAVGIGARQLRTG